MSEFTGSEYSDQLAGEIEYLKKFRFRQTEFELENLAKAHGVVQELSDNQRILLETTPSHFDDFRTSNEFLSVIQDSSDLRSFRAIFNTGQFIDYKVSITCVDIYFHSFDRPTIFLRTGYPDAIINPMFFNNFIFDHKYMKKNLAGLGVINTIYMYLIQITDEEAVENCVRRDLNDELASEEAENFKLFLSYASPKYGILDQIQNPVSEFSEATKSFFIMKKDKIIVHLDFSLIHGDYKFEFAPDSPIPKLNQSLMQVFESQGFMSAQNSLYKEIKALLDTLPSPQEILNILKDPKNSVVLTEATQDDPQPPESKTSYFQELKDLRFNQYDFYSNKRHSLLQKVTDSAGVNTNRLNKEIRILSQHLPCESTGAIFVVMDSERMDLIKALVSGTVDTPYSHGLFEFHIACPPEYPNSPPLVDIVTTGSGCVRFNPNLYDDGFVCLSVINTWDGDPSERWNPAHSNILQVLLSIQVLVMDNMIIQKEPEFEHLAADSWENKLYCNIVRYNNVKYAMLGMLKNPPEEFKQVVETHFAIKRTEIMETVDNWLESAKSFSLPTEEQIDYLVMDHNPRTCSLFKSQSYYSLLLEARNELLTLLNALPSLDTPRRKFEIIELTEELANMRGFYSKMYKYQKISVSFDEAGGYQHSLGHLASLKPLNLKRLEEDHKSLESLRCSPDSTIFMLTDTNHLDLLKIIISGPVGTDYSNGLFLFDIVCPDGYPEVPPKAKLVTNGRFTVDFHPNLKKNGDVCGVPWNSEWNLLQFFKEVQNTFYKHNWNEIVKKHETRYNTLRYAIIDWAVHPPEYLKEMVSTYMDMKKTEIQFVAGKWIEEYQNFTEFEHDPSNIKTNKTETEEEDSIDLETFNLDSFEAVYSELEVIYEGAYSGDSGDSEEFEGEKWKEGVDGSEAEME